MVNTPPESVHTSNTPPITPRHTRHNSNETEYDDVTRISKLDFGDPLYLHASDTLSTPLIGFNLLGTENYKSDDDPILAKQWDRCNAVVLNWILGCVSQELYLGQIYSKNAAVVWQDLKDTYDKIDGSVIFNIHQKINYLAQNGSNLAEYYHKLTSLWKQFDAIMKLPACSCKAAKELQTHTDLMKLMQFLMRLDDVYMSVRSNILMRDPLPSVKTAFNIVSREESHRGGYSDKSYGNSASSFAAKTNFSRNNNNRSYETKRTFDNNFESKRTFEPSQRTFRPPNPNLNCTHCHKVGHTIDRCFQLANKKSGQHGGKFSNNNAHMDKTVQSVTSSLSNDSASSSVQHALTADQVSKLLSLLDTKTSPSNLQANMAGIPMCSNSWFLSCNAFLFNAIIKWIIDSGANQHMTVSEKGLTNVVDISDLGLKIGHPNGTYALVQKIGNLHLKNGIILFDVLVVPDYSVNLMSVHKLCRDNKLQVSFDEDKCYIQDFHQKTLLGTGSEQGGLYVFDDSSMCNSVVCNYATLRCESKMLWHLRLGHPAD
uniref:uncharacterized protein LOC122592206 n=1 Tax=Erigeron canadensis TaxID=72917 RepID=UPI001CB8E421|nr:uncharacterized protein LOC122592206 [Erigeron canadensis]